MILGLCVLYRVILFSGVFWCVVVRSCFQFILGKVNLSDGHLLVGVKQFLVGWRFIQTRPTPTNLLKRTCQLWWVTHWNVCINGSDVANAISFLSHYTCEPSQWFYMSWHGISEDLLARHFWKYLNVFELFCPSWWESACCFQWHKVTEKWRQVNSNTLQSFQSHSENAFIIGPRLTASTHRVGFIWSPAGRSLVHSISISFFFV